ncbi:hypothetical protein Patl1_33623 [Pistacia atlantica]|uniref:Uncharacterized protein n=1 Tax=Pistacia atlantica TaxID=434234 RepID=A0ACC0ZQU2_9ROSI|nr:hypothetical protein Patl1_33623 [Pistacia atlantica]
MSIQYSLPSKRKSPHEEVNPNSESSKKTLIASSQMPTPADDSDQLQSLVDEGIEVIEPIRSNTPSSILVGSGKTKSVVWLHFTKVKVDGKDKVKCNYCRKQLIDTKLLTLTVDNCSTNDAVVQDLLGRASTFLPYATW